MIPKLRSLAAALVLLANLGLAGHSACAQSVHTAHLDLELISEGQAVPGKSLLVGLRQTIAPGWHTYWRNPGDAGEATTLDWTLPKGWSAGPLIWPAPTHVTTGPLMNYVYSDAVVLPTRLKVPADADIGASVTLTAHASLLVCKDVCVPEEANLTLNLRVGPSNRAASDPEARRLLSAALAATPLPFATAGRPSYQIAGDQIWLDLHDAKLAAQVRAGKDLYFYPYLGTVMDQAKPQSVTLLKGEDGVRIGLASGYDFSHGKAPSALDGVVTVSGARAIEVHALAGEKPASVTPPPLPVQTGGAPNAAALPGVTPPPTTATPVVSDTPPARLSPPDAHLNLVLAVLFALMGGLLLNLMPCVFPVLSIKAAALARHTAHPHKAQAEGLAYLAGVVASFLGLAFMLIIARRAGQAVGWGFQLQAPGAVFALCLVMLGSALNLSGLFEMGLSAQGAGQGLASKGGLVGAFFTGVLAVVVAAPCTGPFMASTIGWALAQSDLVAALIFASLGLGLAAPFVALAFLPGLYKRMPKPGAWMDGLRKTLAFPMYGAAGWLAWVFAEEAGADALPALFAAGLALAFGLWLWGVGQRADGVRLLRAAQLGAGLSVLAAIGIGVVAAPKTAPAATHQGQTAAAWSPERVTELVREGRPVFVDFTAAWCVTCKVNEAGALATSGVKSAFAKTGTVYLRADWTNRNGEIAKALSAEGRAGVPLYLVYSRRGGPPQILPQVLTEGVVTEALTHAAQ